MSYNATIRLLDIIHSDRISRFTGSKAPKSPLVNLVNSCPILSKNERPRPLVKVILLFLSHLVDSCQFLSILSKNERPGPLVKVLLSILVKLVQKQAPQTTGESPLVNLVNSCPSCPKNERAKGSCPVVCSTILTPRSISQSSKSTIPNPWLPFSPSPTCQINRCQAGSQRSSKS